MSLLAGLFRAVGVVGLSWLAVFGMVSAPSASFTLSPTNPSVGTAVQFTDTSAGGPTSWQWDFGDGQNSTSQSPVHTFVLPGTYQVTLKSGNPSGQTQTQLLVNVSPEGTLRLMSAAGRPFDVTLTATDPRTGNAGVGKAIPQNDVFGYFTIPTLVPTSGPVVPEVFVKMLDARAIGQDFWLFWGGLTDLTYTLTVTDTTTGIAKVEHNPVTTDRNCLSADTSGFQNVPTPTPTTTGVAPTPTPTPPAGQTQVVQIRSNLFRDSVSGNSTTTIHVGDKVEWEWEEGFHSTTSGSCTAGCQADGKWNEGPTGTVGHKFDLTFTQAGTYPYFCSVHGASMTGTVVVN